MNTIKNTASTRIVWIFFASIFASMILLGEARGLQISEIMFNPDGADTGREWIEITLNESEGCINLTEYKLFEENTNHNIYAYTDEVFCKYAIISADINKFLEDYKYLNESLAHNSLLNKSDVTIYKSSFGLNNIGEIVAIRHGNEFMDYINYSMLLSEITIAEGYSLDLEDNVWEASLLINGDPGNVLAQNSSENGNQSEHNGETPDQNTTNITTNITINVTANSTTNNSFEINDSVDNYSSNHSSPINNSIINNNFNNSSNCNALIYVSIKNYSVSTIYENDAQIKFYNKIEFNGTDIAEKNYTIEYWIEDLSGNIVKSKITTNNQNEKSFTPKIDETDKILIIKNLLIDINCTVTNNSGEKILLVKNSNYTSPAKSCSCPSCPSCDSKSTQAAQCSILNDKNYGAECSQAPIIKTVNVCNFSKAAQNITQNMKLSAANTNTNSKNNSMNSIAVGFSNNTQNAGKTTGMIVYESPNLKNRLYALIGLILVGLTCIGIIGYKIYVSRINKPKGAQTKIE